MYRVFVIALIVTFLVACAVSPTGRRQLQIFPSEQMVEMGAAAFDTVREQMSESDDAQLNAYVQCVADAITEQLDEEHAGTEWEVVLFDEESANAFALPGGKIGVHTGLLDVARNQDQLATVMAHEVAHVLADHANERVSTAYATEAGLQLAQVLAGGPSEGQDRLMAMLGLGAQFGILLPFSRTQESEADIVGLDLMARAGFDPRESVRLWENMGEGVNGEPPEFLSTHPSHGRRIQDLESRMPTALDYYEEARAQGLRPQCS